MEDSDDRNWVFWGVRWERVALVGFSQPKWSLKDYFFLLFWKTPWTESEMETKKIASVPKFILVNCTEFWALLEPLHAEFLGKKGTPSCNGAYIVALFFFPVKERLSGTISA